MRAPLTIERKEPGLITLEAAPAGGGAGAGRGTGRGRGGVAGGEAGAVVQAGIQGTAIKMEA